MSQFRSAKFLGIRCLETGRYQYELRSCLEEKNWLATGQITPTYVAKLIERCRLDQYSLSEHRLHSGLMVNTFRPVYNGMHWYIKFYFPPVSGSEADEDLAMFISVHPS